MKKILSLVLGLMLLLVGCKNEKEASVKGVLNYLEKLDSYSLTSAMTISRPDKEVNMNVCVDYLAPNYYKVVFKTDSGSEQIIIKNDDGVYVITPSINKQFKFDSDWPLNSSHAYLLESIVKDIKADQNVVLNATNGVINVECIINHKTNHNLVKMVYSCNLNDFTPISSVFYNSNDEAIIKVNFKDFLPNKDLKKDYFNEKLYLNNEESGAVPDEDGFTVSSEYVLEGNILTTSTTENNVTILCYSGEKPYTIIVQEVISYSEVVVFDEYRDFEILEVGLCFINDNYMRYYLGNYEVTIYSNNLSVEDYLNIAAAISLT